MSLFRLLRPALVLFGLLTLITGLVYPLLVTAVAQGVFPLAGQWQPDHPSWPGRRLRADRPGLRSARVLLGASLGHGGPCR